MKVLNQLDGASQIVTDANNRFVSDTEKTAIANAMSKNGGTFTGPAIGQANASYTTAQLRNVKLKQGVATDNFTTTELGLGEIGFIYE